MRLPLMVDRPVRMASLIYCGVLFVCAPNGRAATRLPEPIPSFDTEVMAVLSKAGCNMGACHGNQNGKGGFRLSLRGEDPSFDYRSLVRDEGGRRLDRLDPEASLLLRKPTLALAHEGGLRFRRDSLEYRVLRDWIAAGAPRSAAGGSSAADPVVDLVVQPSDLLVPSNREDVTLTVTAVFADGTRRDVTALAVFEGLQGPAHVTSEGRVVREGSGEVTLVVRYLRHQVAVRVTFLDAAPRAVPRPESNGWVDEWINQKLLRLGIPPSPVCDDATFVRRAYLDALGIPPTAVEARAFCLDPSPNKRAILIDQLLARPEFADHWALKWSDLLRNEEKVLDPRGVDAYYEWIRGAMSRGMPLDAFIRELLTARGSTYEVPAANFYRAHRDPTTRGETVARVFLGLRLQCARCHNHPFDRWTQDDYYAWASCFTGIDYDIVKNDRRDKFDKHEFVGEQIVKVSHVEPEKNPRTGRPAPPRWLGQIAPAPSDSADRLEQLAAWLTAPDNPWFARVMANLIFYHVMGRGLVEPLDDFRVTNPPSHPELLDALAADLTSHRYDLRHLVRRIMNSHAYQRSAERVEGQPEDDPYFARAVVRRLTAEQLCDAQSMVLDKPAEFAGYPVGTRAGQLHGVRRTRQRDQAASAADRFLRTFGKPERLLACECERSNETSLKQVFTLVGQDLQQRLAEEDNRLARWARGEPEASEIIEDLYWTALSRPPSDRERQACLEQLTAAGDRRAALEDICWALMNSKEFLFRH